MTNDSENADRPTVDELASRLAEIERAMDRIQADDLADAEAAIDDLVRRSGGSPT